MASNSNNPRPQFMGQLKDLCRDLEKKVTDVDMETRATLHCNRAHGNLAADKWRDEVVSLKSELSCGLATAAEERTNLATFLGGMNAELARLLDTTATMQTFMAQYGYQPRPLDAAQLLDWESEPQKEEEELLSDIAPPAASEFEEAGDGRIKEVMSELKIDSPVRKKEELEVQSSAATESPNIFNIGLSKNGMNLLLGKEVSRSSKIALSHDPPKVVPSQPQPKLAPIPSEAATPELPAVSGSQQLAALLEESRYESSPVLKLNTRTFRDISDDSGSAVDITPGLPSRKKSQPSSVQAAPRVPITPDMPAPPDTLAANSLAESPEMPEFTSNFVKALMNAKNQDKPKEGKSRPTPEFPGLSVLKNEEMESSMTRTPDSPELTYFNKV